MTRGEVARYLGKSIATVRRIEGRHLHAQRDERGVFQFEPAEVRELRAMLKRGELRLSDINFTRDHTPSTGNYRAAPAEDALVSIRRQLSETRAVAREAVELFYLVCPERFLAELEPEVLDSFDAVLTETVPLGADEDAEHDWP